MLAAPWDVLLTALFAVTGVACIASLVRHRSGRGPDASGLDDAEVVDVTHGVMSIAMIAMVWLPQTDPVVWTQVGLFGILAIALIPSVARAPRPRDRIDAGSHIALDVAMMWMLAAMPLLMAGDMDAGGGAHAGHAGSDDASAMLAATPPWATAITIGAAIVSASAAAWWAWRSLAAAGHRLHAACHAAMGVGMAAMLLLMT